LLIHDKRDGLSKIDPTDVRVNGTTYGTYIEVHQNTIQSLQQLRDEVRTQLEALTDVFNALGYNHPPVELNAVTEAITQQLEVLDKVNGSTGISVDENGYVVDVFKVHHLLPTYTDLPDDLLKGYWKWDADGKSLVLDEEKYNALWGV